MDTGLSVLIEIIAMGVTFDVRKLLILRRSRRQPSFRVSVYTWNGDDTHAPL
jgi:hypothetical protein